MVKAFISRAFERLIQALPKPVDHRSAFIPVTESNRQLCLQFLVELQEVSNNRYHPLAANSIFITAPCDNINRMLVYIRGYNQMLRENKTIDAVDCNWTMREMTLDQFFVSEDGFYISSATIVQLIEETQRLCEFMDGAEEAEFGNLEHNNRMLTKYFVSLKSILAAFLQVLAD